MPEYAIHCGDRAAFIAGLRELASFLTDHPDVLVPARTSFALLVDAPDSATRRAGTEHAAGPLGAPVDDIGHGYYTAHRAFGSITYSVVAVPPEERQ